MSKNILRWFVQVSMAAVEMVVFHRDKFCFVLFSAGYSVCMFLLSSSWWSLSMSFLPQPPTPTLEQLKVKNLAVKGNCFVLH